MYTLPSLLFLVLSVFLAYTLRAFYRAYTSPLRDIPGPFLARFTRLWLLKATASGSFEQNSIALHRKYGPIVRLAPNEYSIDDAEAAKIIYRYSAWDNPAAEPNLFTETDIARHTERRRQVNSLYAMSALTAVEYQVATATTSFIEKMEGFARGGEGVDMAEWLQYYAFDTVAYITFGKSFGFLEQGTDVAAIMATIDKFAQYGALMGVLSEWHPLVFRIIQLLTPAGTAITAIHDVCVKAMKEMGLPDVGEKETGIESQNLNRGTDTVGAESSEQDQYLRNDYLSTLFARHRKDPGAFTVDDIFYHLFPHIAAGGETTGIALCAAVHYLLCNPRVLEKLRKELDEYSEKSPGLWTLKETQECAYLQAVIKETLRIFPAVGLGLPRVVGRGGLVLAGREFMEGTIVGVNAWVAHSNREVFGEDTETFRPERWLEAEAAEGAGMEGYIFTFGRGPRTCIGKNISLLEINKILPELVQRFDFSPEDQKKGWKVGTKWFVRPRNFRVRVQERVKAG